MTTIVFKTNRGMFSWSFNSREAITQASMLATIKEMNGEVISITVA